MALKTPYPHMARGNQKIAWFRSPIQNIDNGSGTTADHVIFSDLDVDAFVVHVRAVYTEATDTSGAASANFTLGSAAGGTQVVASTALEVSKAVGSATEATLVADGNRIAAGGALFARHTGIAATEAGQYYLQVGVILEP